MYLYMKKCVESGPVVPLQFHWLDSIMSKIPDHLKSTKQQKELINDIVNEIKTNYENSTRKSMGNFRFFLLLVYNRVGVKSFASKLILWLGLTFTVT